jgi:hypothetical protein
LWFSISVTRGLFEKWPTQHAETDVTRAQVGPKILPLPDYLPRKHLATAVSASRARDIVPTKGKVKTLKKAGPQPRPRPDERDELLSTHRGIVTKTAVYAFWVLVFSDQTNDACNLD